MEPFYQSFYHSLQNIGYTHPVHPMLTYVPIGCVIAAFLFDLIALVFRYDQAAVTARHCILIAFIFVFPTILLGYMDWHYFHGGIWLFAFKMKMILAGLLTFLFLIALLLHRKREPTSKLILLIYTLCFFAVVGLGYFGGEIVFGTPTHSDQAMGPKVKVSFVEVFDIFNHNCIICHKGENPPLGLRLDSYEHVMTGSEKGPVVIPGKPAESKLVLRIKGKIKPSMPFGKPLLLGNSIQSVIRWIEEGAPRDKDERAVSVRGEKPGKPTLTK
jgi:uncharacterized membrane protein